MIKNLNSLIIVFETALVNEGDYYIGCSLRSLIQYASRL